MENNQRDVSCKKTTLVVVKKTIQVGYRTGYTPHWERACCCRGARTAGARRSSRQPPLAPTQLHRRLYHCRVLFHTSPSVGCIRQPKEGLASWLPAGRLPGGRRWQLQPLHAPDSAQRIARVPCQCGQLGCLVPTTGWVKPRPHRKWWQRHNFTRCRETPHEMEMPGASKCWAPLPRNRASASAGTWRRATVASHHPMPVSLVGR